MLPAKVRETLSTTADLIAVGTFIVLVLIGAIASVWLWAASTRVPGWTLAIVAAGFLVCLPAAYLLGRRAFRRLPSEAAERARDELEVARTYLSHVEDFLAELRESTTMRNVPATLNRLERLRDLVFDALVQGTNTQPGEHIRCVFFEKREEDGETWLRAKYHRGHSSRVDELKLHPDARSIAGLALTTRDPVYIPDARVDPRVQITVAGRPVVTLLCLCAMGYGAAGSSPIGVFSVASNKPDAFSVSDQEFISICANVIGVIEFFRRVYELVGNNDQEPREWESNA